MLDLGASDLKYLNLVLEYPSLSWTWGYLTIDCLDKNIGYPGLSLTWSQPDWDCSRGEALRWGRPSGGGPKGVGTYRGGSNGKGLGKGIRGGGVIEIIGCLLFIPRIIRLTISY